MATAKEVLTATEASKYLRMRLETFKDLAEAGEIPGRRINSRGDWRFNREDLQSWIRSGNKGADLTVTS